jgi:3,4-dihydroxy 2-butanone 4-phosphate synthase / GTP cyclohydrolase II
LGHTAVEDAVDALVDGRAVVVELADHGALVAVAGGLGEALVRLHGADAFVVTADEVGPSGVGVLAGADDRAVAADLLRLVAPVPAVVCARLGTAPRHVPVPSVVAHFAVEHDLPLVAIDDLVHHRWRFDRLVDEVAVASLPLRAGVFAAHAFRSRVTGAEHIALVLGEVHDGADVLCRIHSECVTGDAFGSLRCDCGPQLDAAIARVGAEGRGVVVYLRGHEGRGIGLAEKLRAYRLQEDGHDTFDANVLLGHPPDGRDYGDAAQILRSLGVASVRLLTNNPAKIERLEALGVDVAARIPLETEPNPHNRSYLDAKRRRFGHLLDGG